MNIKGHCKVELKDVKTGRVEAQEHDNMLTKALEYFYGKGGFTNTSAMNASILRSNALYYMLGGVMCLDTALEGSNEIVRVPAGVGMTANGARDQLNSGAPTELGSYNDTESGWQQDGSLKMVWDWTTSQGNGDIKSVCLSSAFGGFKGIGNKTSLESKSNPWAIGNYNSVSGLSGISGIPLGYKDNKLYSLQAITGVEKWTIKVYDFPYSQIDIRDTSTAREVDEIEVSIPSIIQNLRASSGSGGTQAVYGKMYTIFQKGNHVYMLLLCSEGSYVASYWREYFNNDNPWYAIDYDMANGIVSAIALIPSNTGIPALSDAQGANYLAGISDKWVIIGNTAVEKANLANSIDIANAPASTSDYNHRLLYTEDTNIFLWGNSYGWRYDCVAEKASPTNGTFIGGIGNMTDNPLMIFGGSSLYRDPNYIATIFNLESPVTKTADKTMKVTYVLRFS